MTQARWFRALALAVLTTMTSLASAAQGDASLSLAALESDIAAGREISFPVKYNYYFEDNYGNSTDVGLEDGFVTLSKSTFGFQVTKGYKQSFAIPPEKILELAQQPQQASRLKVKVAIKSVRGNKEIKQDYYFYASGASAVEGGPISCGDCSDSMDALYTLLTKFRTGQFVRMEDTPAAPPAQATYTVQDGQQPTVSGKYNLENGSAQINFVSGTSCTIQVAGAPPFSGRYVVLGDTVTISCTVSGTGLDFKIQGDKIIAGNGQAWVREGGAMGSAQVPLPEIAPPPPPPDAPPPTIALGQTKDRVTAAFGQPVRIAKLGVKEIFYYKDMKVTFTNGKVSNVE